jgi:hypothetical protein
VSRCSEEESYSITSSARSKVTGTSGLTAVAVLRLIISSELVGAFAFAGHLRLIDRAA